MGFRFHPYPSLSNRDVPKIAKDLHELVTEEDLKRYANILLDEREKGKCVRLEILGEENPYVIEVFESSRNGKTRFCFLVYDAVFRNNELGLIEVDSLKCVIEPSLI